MPTREYSNDDTTVVWKSELCIHSEKCARGLIEVFNPKQQPWVNMQGADSKTIRNQVAECPSGALSIKGHWKAHNPSIEIEVAQDGPLLVRGQVTMKLADGSEEEKSTTTALCRCGSSANKPYCDGAHKKVGFEG